MMSREIDAQRPLQAPGASVVGDAAWTRTSNWPSPICGNGIWRIWRTSLDPCPPAPPPSLSVSSRAPYRPSCPSCVVARSATVRFRWPW